MKLFILAGILSTVYCSEKYDKDVVENKGKRIAGGGNFGGFIGLTTYGAGPFLVKGKIDRDNYYEEKDKKEDSKNDDKYYDPKLISDVGYDNEQKYQPYYNGPIRDGNKKYDDEYLEYLGYRGPRGYCIGEYNKRDDYDDNYYGRRNIQNRGNNSFNYFDDEVKNRCDRLFGFTGPTANDEPENLVRPCALDDWQCIRKYFAANSNCKPAYGPIPDPLYLDISTVFYPVVNLTVTLPNLMVRGLSNAKIREFYVNKRSGNLVLALDVNDLIETVPRAYFRYRRTAKESIVLADFSTINYRAVTLTAVIPKVPHLRLDLADIHIDIQDPTPPFVIGPGAANSTDPDVITAFAQFNLLVPFVIREGLLFQSQLFTSIYIQENICDFGLKIVSV